MSSENKICEWFGHRDEHIGNDRTTDFPSETFACRRCGDTHNLNTWGGPRPAPKIYKVAPWLLLGLAAVAYFATSSS